MKEINYAQVLETIHQKISPHLQEGKTASYIPELSKVDVNQFGMSVCLNTDVEYVIGSSEKNFSIQSVSKAFSFVLAYKLIGERLWKRLGREPSGNRFDSLVLLENENGIPRNPFINAGALVVMDILMQEFSNPLKEILVFIQQLSGNPNIKVNEQVRKSEYESANRNFALAYFMKSFDNIKSDVDELLDLYCAQCAIEMTCVDLARSFRLFSTQGLNPWSQKRILSKGQTKRINSILMTCGLYNAVGDFAYRVGIPAKSGVGGAIVGMIPGELSVATWSPGLDSNGNSLVGILALEHFTSLTESSIY